MSMLLDHRVAPKKLLDVLPKLYHNLKTYPSSLAQIDVGAVPALLPFFLDPMKKESTPYGVEVCIALKTYLETCDKVLMDKYLKQICGTLAVILKRQRGNQYGFGDDPDSPTTLRRTCVSPCGMTRMPITTITTL